MQHFKSAGFADKLETIKGTNAELTLIEVRIYDETSTGPHKNDTAFVAHLRKN